MNSADQQFSMVLRVILAVVVGFCALDASGGPASQDSGTKTPRIANDTGTPKSSSASSSTPFSQSYQKKSTQQSNVEFLDQVDRAAQAKLDAFHKAKMCRFQINAHFMELDEETGGYYFRVDRSTPPYALRIVSASYGANCAETNKGNQTATLATACDGTARCDFTVNVTGIGESAPGCKMEYRVEYECGAPAEPAIKVTTLDERANGKKLSFNCAPAAEPGATSIPPDDESSLPTVGQTTFVYSNRQEDEAIRLQQLDEFLSAEYLERMWMEYDAFMYGGTGDDIDEVETDPTERALVARVISLGTTADVGYPKNLFPGAGRCIDDLLAAGITTVSYRNIKSCMRIEETFLTLSDSRVNDYCMPRYQRNPGPIDTEKTMNRKAANEPLIEDAGR